MSVSIFDSFLTTTEIIDVFDDAAVIQAMLKFENALARAQAAEGIIPESAAQAIAQHCDAQRYDIPAIVVASRHAGSMAIPLVKELTKAVAASWDYNKKGSLLIIEVMKRMFTRQVSVRSLSGPIGIGQQIHQAASMPGWVAPQAGYGFRARPNSVMISSGSPGRASTSGSGRRSPAKTAR